MVFARLDPYRHPGRRSRGCFIQGPGRCLGQPISSARGIARDKSEGGGFRLGDVVVDVGEGKIVEQRLVVGIFDFTESDRIIVPEVESTIDGEEATQFVCANRDGHNGSFGDDEALGGQGRHIRRCIEQDPIRVVLLDSKIVEDWGRSLGIGSSVRLGICCRICCRIDGTIRIHGVLVWLCPVCHCAVSVRCIDTSIVSCLVVRAAGKQKNATKSDRRQMVAFHSVPPVDIFESSLHYASFFVDISTFHAPGNDAPLVAGSDGDRRGL